MGDIRSRNATKRGQIGFVHKDSKTVIAAEIVLDAIKITSSIAEQMGLKIAYTFTYVGVNNAWVLEDVRELNKPVPYEHFSQMIWITIDDNRKGFSRRKTIK